MYEIRERKGEREREFGKSNNNNTQDNTNESKTNQRANNSKRASTLDISQIKKTDTDLVDISKEPMTNLLSSKVIQTRQLVHCVFQGYERGALGSGSPFLPTVRRRVVAVITITAQLVRNRSEFSVHHYSLKTCP